MMGKKVSNCMEGEMDDGVVVEMGMAMEGCS